MLSCRHRHYRLHWHDSNPHACHSTSRTIMGVRCGDVRMRAPEEPQAKVLVCIGHLQKMERLVGRSAPLVRSLARAAVTRAPEEPQAAVLACVGRGQKTEGFVG